MIKLPSLQNLVSGALFTLKRFPLVLFCALVGTVVSCYLIELDSNEKAMQVHLYHLLIIASLGLTLFLSIALFTETKQSSFSFKVTLNILGIVALTLYYFLLPERFEKIELYRYLLFNIGLHLLVSFSPFISTGNINGFWQFNKTFFLRILLSALYTCVLYAGLALAILAVEKLFNVSINGNNYFRLWMVLACIFNTWFFLAGVPKNLNELNEETSYPKGLKIFTQFVLLPLVSIYLIILYAYLVKIAVGWQLPKGWVSYLVISFSIAGILSLLLIYPIQNEEGNNWIKVFSRWFYRALYPLIFLLLIAIYKRIHEYGVTENRYYILVLAVWLATIAGYFLLSKTKNIRVIPVSLCIIAFLSSFGPQSSFSISKKSQLNRLEELLSKNNILVNGFITKKHNKIPYKDNARISSILNYLDDTHELYVMQAWFKEPMDSIFHSAKNEYSYKLGLIHDALGIEQVSSYYTDGDVKDDTPFYYYRKENIYPYYKLIKGYDYLVNLSLYREYHQKISLGNSDSLIIKLDTINNLIVVEKNKTMFIQLSMVDIFKNTDSMGVGVQNNYNSVSVEASKMTSNAENNFMKVKMELQSVNGTIRKNKKIISGLGGDLYIFFKDSISK